MSEQFEVVISGIGGHFPMSKDVQAFGQDLLDNKNLLEKTTRWRYDSKLGVQPIVGQIEYVHFDHVFYGINQKLVKNTDPVSKIGYERSFEAIIDAGLHPAAMAGQKIGVWTSSDINEFEQRAMASDAINKFGGYTVMGLSRTMFANRISYYFDFNGPSCAIDGSWASGHQQLRLAANAIKDGHCEAALVVAANLVRFPETNAAMKGLGLMSDDTLTRSFDAAGSGTARSDCAVAFFLQRGDQAKRCYAKVLAADCMYLGPNSTLDLTLPSPQGIERFISGLYRENAIDPKRIAYLEADGSAHPIRDEIELNAIDKTLVQGAGRSDPLLVGSVKSNMGSADCVNGLTGICKAITAMETGTIPATLNFHTPNAKAKGLLEGRLKVVAANTPLNMSADSVLAVNSLSLSSIVGHTVLQANPRAAQGPQDPAQHLPRLVPVSARTEDGAHEVVKRIQSTPFDTNYCRLVQDAFSKTIRGYDYRSFVICPPLESEVPAVVRIEKRTVWFVYSGMGSQWAGMGAGLMQLPVFAETIERLHKILEPKGMDLKTILTETGPDAFDNITKSFVGITACQLALTNVLKALGIVPDGIAGHSAGEVACAYADDCLTEEQSIIAAYARGVASNQATLIHGSMAAVGMGYKDVLPLLPPTIDVACHNSDTSCTLSGPAEDVKVFVKKLSDQGVFARTVNVSDIAYHSRYIQPAAPFLRKSLAEVIPNPKKRSAKWITTSVPIDQRDSDLATYCSADYQTNNLLSPVLFEEALAYIPEHAVVIEVAPHGLLQAILKRALPSVQHISLTQRGQADPVRFLLSAIGQMTYAGVSPKISALYPDVEFPVPRGTASLARLVTTLRDESTNSDMFGELTVWSPVVLELTNDSPRVNIRGTYFCPLSSKLMLAWQVQAKRMQQPLASSPITVRELHIKQWTKIPKEGSKTLIATFMSASSKVEVVSDDAGMVLHSSIHILTEDSERPPPLPALDMASQDVFVLGQDELYRDLAARGVVYTKESRNIISIQMGDRDWVINVQLVQHDGKWVALLEALAQCYILRATNDAQEVYLPRGIQRLDLDPAKLGNRLEVVLRLNLATGVLVGDGIYVIGVAMEPAPALVPADTPTKSAALQDGAAPQFLPFGETKFESLEEFVRMTVSTVLEQSKTPGQTETEINLMELPNGKKTTDLSKALLSAVETSTGVKPRLVTLTPEGTKPSGFKGRVPLLVTGPGTLTEAVCALSVGLADALLVWSAERLSGPRGASTGMSVLAEQGVRNDWLTLLRRAEPLPEDDTAVVILDANEPAPKAVSAKAGSSVVLVWRGLAEAAILDKVREVDARPYANQAKLVFVLDNAAAPFALKKPLYADQLARGVRINVLKGGVWGTCTWKGEAAESAPRQLSSALRVSTLDDVKLEFLGVNPMDLTADAVRHSGHVDYVGSLQAKGASAKRVMGVARWLADDRGPKLDALLRWPVPQGWAAEDAATVPYIYSLMYYTLKVKAEARSGESILVHEGASAMGQAALRIATQLGCSPMYTTVRSAEERRQLQAMFPQLEPSHVLTCGDGGSFEFPLRTMTGGKGVRLVVNSLPDAEMKASLRCLSFWGRMLHYQKDDMLAARTIASVGFLQSTAIFGFSGGELFHACERDRLEVAAAMAQGLRDGTVQPIVGAKVLSAATGVTDCDSCRKVVIKVDQAASTSSLQCDPHKSYIVAGKHASDVLHLAARLSLLGARHILATVASPPSSALVRQRQHVLKRQNGTHLHVQQVRAWDAKAAAGVVKAAAGMAPVRSTVVFAKDESDLSMASLLNAALEAERAECADLVLVAEQAECAEQLAVLAAKRGAQGRRTSYLTASLNEAVNHLAGLISSSTSSATVMASASQEALSNREPTVPRDPQTLASMGRAVSRCAAAPQGVRVRELPNRGLRANACREVTPLYVLPSLGVLDPASTEQLTSLAARLFSPVLVLETAHTDAAKRSVQLTAKAVLQAMLSRQPHGPYNVLGWELSTVLALEVQRQLEAAGKCGVLYLVHGDVEVMQQWAEQHAKDAVVAVNGAASAVDAEDARRGAAAIAGLLGAIAAHKSDVDGAFAGRVNVARGSLDDQQSLRENDPHVHIRTLADPRLDNDELALLLNDNAAWSQLAGSNDLRLAVELEGRSP